MGKRSTSRRLAMQIVYEYEAAKTPVDKAVENVLSSADFIEETKNFARQLACGAIEKLADIDLKIASISTNWKIDRLSLVDKSILRLAVFEMSYDKGSPPKVVIDEAIELAKKFGSADSPKFVNGILGFLVKTL